MIGFVVHKITYVSPSVSSALHIIPGLLIAIMPRVFAEINPVGIIGIYAFLTITKGDDILSLIQLITRDNALT
jgi:hypothetical protein